MFSSISGEGSRTRRDQIRSSCKHRGRAQRKRGDRHRCIKQQIVHFHCASLWTDRHHQYVSESHIHKINNTADTRVLRA
ncbi:hypothetical protein KP509_06G066600 [Ceratopteris richardii]|uniref:Uncharacterized protein n=1 Tax=Ceratopteris richardii TaxID=49495 RepID=A0A8T2UTM6_CERRI|nr:hypothetical protein KP509_06G066600 [Ceratopteris richardii]